MSQLRQTHSMDPLYATAQLQNLFAMELDALAPILAGIYGNFGLFLRADARAPARLPKHLLGNVFNVALDDATCASGAIRCAPQTLPIASESINLVIAQHVLERVSDPAACVAEFSRVLAPEGVALIIGFNPLSLWRPWLAWHSHRDCTTLELASARQCRALLDRQAIQTLQTRFVGACVPALQSQPRSAETARTRVWMLGNFCGSWLLLARKRRSTLTPLRMNRKRRDLRGAQLTPGAWRECA